MVTSPLWLIFLLLKALTFFSKIINEKLAQITSLTKQHPDCIVIFITEHLVHCILAFYTSGSDND